MCSKLSFTTLNFCEAIVVEFTSMGRGKLMVELAIRALKNDEDISMNEDVQNLTKRSYNTIETNRDESNEPSCSTNHELIDTNTVLSNGSSAEIPANEDVQNITKKSYSTIAVNRDDLNHSNEPSCSTNHELLDENIVLSDGSSDLYEPSDLENLSSSEEEDRKRKKLTRWKKSTPENWEKNKMKRKRKSSQPYRTKQGLKAGKSPKDINCDSCRWHCTLKFDNDYRKDVCSSFWRLDYCRQKDFIINHVTNEQTKTKRIRTGTGINKQNSRMYFFKKGDERIRVCKTFFLRTLSISHRPVEKALAGKNDAGIFIKTDQRGKKEPPNKTDPSVIRKVKLHIESFPTVESHYCRKTTKRQYLDPNLSIRKMYELYVAEAKKKEKDNGNMNEPIVSEITYRRFFSENYNLSFFHPKKDQCIICNNHKNEKQDEKIRIEYEAHMKRKNEANKAKIEDKLRAVEDKSFISVSFDLQSVLQIPSSAASQMYYSRKINVYNLTVYESAPPNKGYCFFWSEINGQRGSCEIGTALFQWILQVPNHVNEISLFSDTCSGQNRNQFIAALFMYIVQSTHLRVIEHKFLEKGHSHMECDSMHSVIESAKRHVSVYSLNDWLNIFLTARSCRKKGKGSGSYIVSEIKFSDIINLKNLAAKIIKNRSTDSTGEQVNWLRIKVLRYEKEKPGVILFKYSHEDQEFRLIQTYGRGRPSVITGDLPKLYNSLLPISEAKKKDLMRLCGTNVIPQEFHAWFKSLPVDKKKTDRAPEPSVSDDSDE